MKHLFARAIMCWALLALPARAQEEDLRAAPDSLDYGLIEMADAEGVFEPIPDGQVSVRHARSGLICRFDREAHGRLILFPGLPRGEDVGCDFPDGPATITLYATRYPAPTNIDEQVRAAAAHIRMRFANARIETPEIGMDMAVDGAAPLPESRSARFLVTFPDGRRLYTRVSVALIDGWVIKMRFSQDAPDETAAIGAEMAASLTWMATLQDFAARGGI